MDKRLGSGNVSAYRNVVNIAEPQQVHFVRLMRLGAQRVSEKQQQVYLIAGNTGAYLLISALGAAQIALYVKPCGLSDHLACSSCSAKIVAGQHTAVGNAELHHKFFFCVMSYKSNIQFNTFLSL